MEYIFSETIIECVTILGTAYDAAYIVLLPLHIGVRFVLNILDVMSDII